MTKRERASIVRRIDRLIVKVGKKRDELRAALGDIDGIVESINAAEEPIEAALFKLREARREIDDASDELSRYV